MPAPFQIDPKKVRTARKTLGLSQGQFAEFTGLSKGTISSMENSGVSSHEKVQQLALKLSISVEELLPDENQYESNDAPPGLGEGSPANGTGTDESGKLIDLESNVGKPDQNQDLNTPYLDSHGRLIAWIRQPLGIAVTALILGNFVLAVLLINGMFGARKGKALDHQILSNDLATHAPDVFYGRPGMPYEFSRVIPRNSSLKGETNFVKELDDTIYSFDMLANTAGVVREQWLPIIEEGLRRGVDYRIILSDYRESNHRFEDFSKSVNEQTVLLSRGASIEHHKQLEELLERINADEAKGKDREFRGTLQVKWNPRVLLYTMWIRDAREKDALAHLGVHFYQGKNQWPNFRFSKEVAPDMVENMVTEFEVAWQSSLDYGELPFPPEEDRGEP